VVAEVLELAERAVDPEAPADEKQRASESQSVPVPPVPLPPAGGDTRCNTYLPWTSTLDRFLWVVQWFAANGFYVVLDDHMIYDTLVLDDPVAWTKAR